MSDGKKVNFVQVVFTLQNPSSWIYQDIERSEIEFVCKSTGCKPIASIDHFTSDMLANAELVEEVNVGTGRVVKVRSLFII